MIAIFQYLQIKTFIRIVRDCFRDKELLIYSREEWRACPRIAIIDSLKGTSMSHFQPMRTLDLFILTNRKLWNLEFVQFLLESKVINCPQIIIQKLSMLVHEKVTRFKIWSSEGSIGRQFLKRYLYHNT